MEWKEKFLFFFGKKIKGASSWGQKGVFIRPFCIIIVSLCQRGAVPNSLPNLRTANMFAFVIPVHCTEFGTSVQNIVRISNVRNIYSSPYIDLPYNKSLRNYAKEYIFSTIIQSNYFVALFVFFLLVFLIFVSD